MMRQFKKQIALILDNLVQVLGIAFWHEDYIDAFDLLLNLEF